MYRLDEKVAIVTGASRGIGRAIAVDLARHGATVVVNFNRSPEEAHKVVAEILAAGGKADAVQADVSKPDQAEALIQAAIDHFGSLDILVNNAGTTRDQLIMKLSEDDWDTVLDTNLKSAFNCSKAAIRPMMRKRFGRIINITSVVGITGNAGQSNYAASKAGLIGLTRSLAREVASRKITVNAVAPGFIPTNLTVGLPDDVKEAIIRTIPLGRWGEPEEVAHAVTFLASDNAAYITGQVLPVDGGMVMA